ncbi:MAG: AAA family ATPase [bacterium]
MIIKKLVLENYRIFSKGDFEFERGINWIIGKNSIGKTSLLESILFCFSGELINPYNPISFNQDSASIFIQIELNQILHNLSIVLQRKKNNNDSSEQFEKKIYHNGKAIQRLIDIKQKFLVPNFINVFDISSNDPESKRKVIDRFILTVDEDYSKYYNDYKKVLKQKTSILKTGSYQEVLESINKRIIKYSSYISAKRIFYLSTIINDLYLASKKIWKEIDEIVILYSTVSNRTFRISLNSGLENSRLDLNVLTSSLAEDYQMGLEKYREQELEKQKVIVSSNRDNFEFIIGMKGRQYFVKHIFSQSQINMFILLFFFSLVKQVKRKYNYYPILLLDEPFVFLDKENTLKMIRIMQNYPQVIVSSSRDEEVVGKKIFL